MLTVDGYFAGEDGNIDWHNVDDEFNDFAIEHTAEFGTLIFGHTTYKLFEDFWPAAIKDPKFSPEDHKIGQIIDDMEKIVFSKTLDNVTWNNSKLFHEINPEEIKKWKSPSTSSGSNEKPMAIFGSGTIVQEFTRLGLVDEYRLMINPVILGKGKPLFKDVDQIKLKLLNTKIFKNGNVLFYYVP